jgi:hypothetical protein
MRMEWSEACQHWHPEGSDEKLKAVDCMIDSLLADADDQACIAEVMIEKIHALDDKVRALVNR